MKLADVENLKSLVQKIRVGKEVSDDLIEMAEDALERESRVHARRSKALARTREKHCGARSHGRTCRTRVQSHPSRDSK